MGMRIWFSKVDGGRLCTWRAQPTARREFRGTTMASGRDLPHDLAQFVVEDVLALSQGFWGLLGNGATFESVGRRRTTPGQRLITTHRDALFATEHEVNAHVAAWQAGGPTVARPALDAMFARWRALPIGDELLVEWRTRRLPRPGHPRRHRSDRLPARRF